MLATPLLREGEPIGAIGISRTEVRPFTEKQISAAQDVRRPGGDRHRERAAVQGTGRAQHRITEALEQQTATSEILRVIASSPTDIQPVLDTIVENAARVCGARGMLRSFASMATYAARLVAVYGTNARPRLIYPLNRGSSAGRAIIDRKTIHVMILRRAGRRVPGSDIAGAILATRTFLPRRCYVRA